MEKRRNSFEVISTILSALIQNEFEHKTGMGPTNIMNHAKTTYKLTNDYLEILKRKQMVKVRNGLYKITPHGADLNNALIDLFDIWGKHA